MKVNFLKPKFQLPRYLKHDICDCIYHNRIGHLGIGFYVHFDVMRKDKGFYAGYVDTWIGSQTKRLNTRRKHYIARVV